LFFSLSGSRERKNQRERLPTAVPELNYEVFCFFSLHQGKEKEEIISIIIKK